jgi:hypothetical protein
VGGTRRRDRTNIRLRRNPRPSGRGGCQKLLSVAGKRNRFGPANPGRSPADQSREEKHARFVRDFHPRIAHFFRAPAFKVLGFDAACRGTRRLCPRVPWNESGTEHCDDKQERPRRPEKTPCIRPHDENINHFVNVSILRPASKFQHKFQSLNRINLAYVVL